MAKRVIESLEVRERLAADGAEVAGLDAPFAWPQGNGVLHPAHGATVYGMERYVSKGGNDAWHGLTPMWPKRTIKAAVLSLAEISGTKWIGTIHVGPGVFYEEPIGAEGKPLGQGFRLIGSGTNPVTGTDIRLAPGAGPEDDLLTFIDTEWIHSALIRDVRFDLEGRGRDAVRMGRGGFVTQLESIVFANVPRWGMYHTEKPTTLRIQNVAGSYMGFGQGTGMQTVTFADVGGGAFHVTNLDVTRWAPGHVLRLNATVALPGDYEQHRDYHVVLDGGVLRLSDSPGGAPKAASSAGAGTVRVYGGDRIPDLGPVTFADTGGGAFHPVNPLSRDWKPDDVVRVRSTGLLPGSYEGGRDYHVVELDGTLYLSETPGGAPKAATSAGTGIVRLEDGYDPEYEGGLFYFNNGLGSNLGQCSTDGLQVDMCGRHPIHLREQPGNPTAVAMYELRNVEAEVMAQGGAFIHDSLVSVRGGEDVAKAAILLDNVVLHTAGGGVNLMKAVVKQLDGGSSRVVLSTRNVQCPGGQYDFLFSIGDQSLLVDWELAALFAHGGPIVLHGHTGDEVVLKITKGARATGGHPHAMLQVRADGRIELGTGASAPVTRLVIGPTGQLQLVNAQTVDPGRAGELWVDGGGFVRASSG